MGDVHMKLKIQDIHQVASRSVTVQLPNSVPAQQVAHYRWFPSSITIPFSTTEISGGMVYAYPHSMEFETVEYHEDYELYCIYEGSAVMILCDIKDGKPIQKSIQLIRIEAGTQLLLHPRTGHSVPIALGENAVRFMVVSPKMAAHIVPLDEKVLADVQSTFHGF